MKRLENKVALVTGGSRGIGAAIVKRLAAEGADVAFTYMSSPEKANALVHEIEQTGGKARAIYADSGNRADVQAAVQKTVDAGGKLDILVNSAGVFLGGTIHDAEIGHDVYERQFAVNVSGVVTAVKEASKHMGNGGRIVTIGSTVAEGVPFAGMGDYAATKAAVAGYTRGWARDFGSKNITVNTIQPGPIDTDMNPADSDLARMMMPSIALGRYGKAEEVAAAVAFLVSAEASFITGTTLTVDGGHLA